MARANLLFWEDPPSSMSEEGALGSEQQLVHFLKGRAQVSLEDFRLYFVCFLKYRQVLFQQFSSALLGPTKSCTRVRIVLGEPREDSWEGVGEIEFVQKEDKDTIGQKFLSENERECLESLYSSLSSSSCTKGAEYVVWLLHVDRHFFLMWPHAPTCLEFCEPVPADCLMRWSQHILSGLTFLHNQGFVHRDIQPKNVLITGFSVAMICDLENAATIADKDEWTKVDKEKRRGRPGGFAAPEFLSPGLYSTRTDVWGFCATVCVSFTGLAETRFRKKGQWRSTTHLDNLSEYKETDLTKLLKSVLIKSEGFNFEADPKVYRNRPFLGELQEKWPTKEEHFRRKPLIR